MVPARFIHLEPARAEFSDRVDRLAPYLRRSDPLADAVATAFSALPFGQGMRMLDDALARGIEAVPQAPAALRELFVAIDRVPPWVDWNAFDRGGALLLRAGALGGMALGTYALLLGYASPGGNKPLVLSGRLKEQAARRLNETSRFVQAVCRPGGMRRHGDGFAIAVKVRLMHAEVRRMILASGRWDETRWGTPINQHDMAATTLLFSLTVMDALRKFGFDIEHDEGEAYVSLWRYVGLVMGCDPELTPASEWQGWQLITLIRATQGPPDEDARALTRALFDAPFATATTPGQHRSARLHQALGHASARWLLGATLADALSIPRSPLAPMLPVLRQLTRATEQLRRRSPALHRRAVAAGAQYWDRVVEIGLAGATAEFRPPARLAGAL